MAARHEPVVPPPVAAARQRSAVDNGIRRILEVIEHVLVYVVALFLIGFAVLALVNTVEEVARNVFILKPDYNAGITSGIDNAFLTVILLELLHTVLSRGPISRQLQEFLVIGITSAVRHSLEITAAGTKESARNIVINLGINALGVLILVGALWLVRQERHAEAIPEPTVPGEPE